MVACVTPKGKSMGQRFSFPTPYNEDGQSALGFIAPLQLTNVM